MRADLPAAVAGERKESFFPAGRGSSSLPSGRHCEAVEVTAQAVGQPKA